MAAAGVVGAIDLDLRTDLLDRWEVESFTPNIRIRHRAKPVEVWLTRSGAVVLSLEERGVSLGVRLPPREGLRWREAPQPGVDTPEDEERATRRDGIYALRRESPGFYSALGGVMVAQSIRLQRRTLPRWLALCRFGEEGMSKPRSAIEAIIQGLEAEPGELVGRHGVADEAAPPMPRAAAGPSRAGDARPSGPASTSSGSASGGEKEVLQNASVIAWSATLPTTPCTGSDGERG
ncbi:hypothetical protein T484DRAFT_2906782 [Baffinella frigidus]|nr:hypothetical protein T484DRAFT_2906782 [Cryptophyta sp. CCMP2293]